MIAVADTSPLCYLVLIGEIDLLPSLFSEVLVPPGVAAELADARAPETVQEWWKHRPAWARIVDPGDEPPPEAVRLPTVDLPDAYEGAIMTPAAIAAAPR